MKKSRVCQPDVLTTEVLLAFEGHIHTRYYPWYIRPDHVCTPEDLWNAWDTNHPISRPDTLNVVSGLIKKHRPPHLVFVGDSNVARLGEAVDKKILSCKILEFLKGSSFVGVGGTKWWLMHTELHGIIKSSKKQ